MLTTTLSKIETGGHLRPTWQPRWSLDDSVDWTFLAGASPSFKMSITDSLSNASPVLPVDVLLMKHTSPSPPSKK